MGDPYTECPHGVLYDTGGDPADGCLACREAAKDARIADLERRLRRVIDSRSRLDCRYAGENYADVSGSHCAGSAETVCQRCEMEQRIADLERRLADAEAREAARMKAAPPYEQRLAIEVARAEAAERELRETNDRLIGQITRAEEAERERDALKVEYEEEVAEFNAGFECARDGGSEGDEPDGLKHDVWLVGFAWQRFEALKRERDEARAEVERLREAVDAGRTMLGGIHDYGYDHTKEHEILALKETIDVMDASGVYARDHKEALRIAIQTAVREATGALRARLDRALALLRETPPLRDGYTGEESMWHNRQAALLAETEGKPSVDPAQAMASEPLTRTDVRREINRWCSERGVTITLDTRDDLVRRLAGRIWSNEPAEEHH